MRSLSDKRTRSEGVTLLEMLIVLAIISISTVAFTLMTNEASRRSQAVRNAEMIASAIRGVRADALATGRPKEMTFIVAERAYKIDGGPSAYLPTGLSMEFTGASEIFSSSGEGVLHIYADGSSSGAVIRILSEQETDSIFVDWLTGSVRMTRERRRR